MKLNEALGICDDWFAYLEREKQRAVEIQKLAVLARTGPDGQKEAQRRLRQMDMQSVTVYDGGRLEPAVRFLVKLARQQFSATGDV